MTMRSLSALFAASEPDFCIGLLLFSLLNIPGTISFLGYPLGNLHIRRAIQIVSAATVVVSLPSISSYIYHWVLVLYQAVVGQWR